MTTVDRFGRVTLAREVRRRLGLVPGSPLDVSVEDGEVRLRPRSPGGRLVRKQGVLVWMPRGPIDVSDPAAWGVRRILQEDHEERARRIWGGRGSD